MRSSARLLPLLVVPSVAACGFLLDFDSLQSGGPKKDAGADTSSGGGGAAGSGGTGGTTGGTGGTAGTGGSTGGAAGSGGTGGCSKNADCDDSDPCTIDACVTPDAGSPFCLSQGKLVEDAALDVPSPGLLGVSTGSAPGHFYVSKYFHVPMDGSLGEWHTALVDIPIDLDAGSTLTPGTPIDLETVPGVIRARGPAGLALESGKLVAFAAYDKNGLGNWLVKRITFDPDLTNPVAEEVCSSACYSWTFDGARHPMPIQTPAGAAAAVWIGPNGIWVGSKASQQPTNPAIPAASPDPAQLSPIVTASSIGAYWCDGNSACSFSFIDPSSGAKATVPAPPCTPSLLSTGVATAGLGWYWAVATGLQGTSPTMELRSFACDKLGCQAISKCGDNLVVTPNVKLPGLVAFARGPAPSGSERVHMAGAYVTANNTLSIQASYAEINQSKFEIARFGLYSGPTVAPLANEKASERPQVAYANDRILVAWNSQGQTEQDDVLRLRRYKFQCPPQ